VVSAVDPAIFRHRYCGHCFSCTFCHDGCCDHGVDVAIVERDRILAHARELEPRIGVSSEQWFDPNVIADSDFPGGASTRTAVRDGQCVFRLRGARGCALHAFALERREEYHDIKPMVSTLFPVTFGDGALLCSDELADRSLVCAGDGPTAYEMARGERLYYFGDALVAELDALAARPMAR
jgi:Fe-S-cluster containining protein